MAELRSHNQPHKQRFLEDFGDEEPMKMKRYLVFVVFFVVSMLAFVIGAFAGNMPLVFTGMTGTLVLFLVRKSFIPS
jgi:hypothetical protein